MDLLLWNVTLAVLSDCRCKLCCRGTFLRCCCSEVGSRKWVSRHTHLKVLKHSYQLHFAHHFCILWKKGDWKKKIIFSCINHLRDLTGSFSQVLFLELSFLLFLCSCSVKMEPQILFLGFCGGGWKSLNGRGSFSCLLTNRKNICQLTRLFCLFLSPFCFITPLCKI